MLASFMRTLAAYPGASQPALSREHPSTSSLRDTMTTHGSTTCLQCRGMPLRSARAAGPTGGQRTGDLLRRSVAGGRGSDPVLLVEIPAELHHAIWRRPRRDVDKEQRHRM